PHPPSFPTRRSSDLLAAFDQRLRDRGEAARHLLRLVRRRLLRRLVFVAQRRLRLLRPAPERQLVLAGPLDLDVPPPARQGRAGRSEEHTSELQSQSN